MRTSSTWGAPPSRHYEFLRRLAQTRCNKYDYDLAVLGCADGKYVLPAARRGMSVLAVDRDEVALRGGPKPWVEGTVRIQGLVQRLKAERLQGTVAVVNADFRTMPPVRCRAVWISGAVQYSCNMPDTAEQIMHCVLEFVASGGLLYVDYMLPYEEKYKGRSNCPAPEWWRVWSRALRGWKTHYNRVLRPIKDPAHIEYPVDHYHQWGHLLLEREL